MKAVDSVVLKVSVALKASVVLRVTVVLTMMLSCVSSLSAEEIRSMHFTMNDGSESSLDQFAGDVVLIVNTASRCGFTGQYAGLQKLHEEFSEQGLTVLAFPSNDFGGQEPGTDEEIRAFCEGQYAVQFPLAARTVVRGSNQHPLFAWLTSEENPDFQGGIRWNFEKFLIGRDGSLRGRFRSGVEPTSEELTQRIHVLLAEGKES